MKNLSWILHAVSLIAIIYLLTQNNKLKNNSTASSSTTIASSSGTASSDADYPIAYFYSDSLLSQLSFFKEGEQSFKKKQENMMAELKNKEGGLQREFQKLQENAPNMTRKELEAGQQKLAKMEQELMMRKENMGAQFAEETAEFNDKLHAKITSYLQELNANKKYKFVFSVAREGNIFYADSALDITPTMVQALNEKYGK